MVKYLDFNGLKRFKNKLSGIFQSKLVSGTNIKTINNNSVLGSGDLTIDIPTKTSDLINDSGFVDKDVNNLTHYTLAVDSGSFIDLDINSTTYVVTLSLKNSSGTVISSDSIDLPLESVVVNGSYDSTNKKIVLTLQSGSTIDIPVGDLISGLQTEITSSNKLASDLVDDTNQVNKFVSTTEKNTWNAKQDVLVSGTNIKTINNESILGLGDIDTSVSWGDIDGTLSDQSDLNSVFNSKQDALISGTNIKTINNESILGSGDISILYDAPIYYIDTNSSSNPFYFCGKKKGLYFFNRFIFSVYYTFDETTHVISEPLGLAHYIVVLNDIPEDVADGTVLAYYVKYSGVNDRYTDYPVTVARQNPGLYNTGLNITSYSARSYVSLDTAQTISSKKTFSTLPESSIVPTTNNQLVNKKYVDDSLVSKQDILVSGSNVKTINNESILGSGDISITGKLPSITTTTNIWELEEGIYDVESRVNLYYKSGGYVTTSSYGAFLFVGHEANSGRPFYLMGRDPLTSSGNRNCIYVGVADNTVYGVIDGYNLEGISSAVTLYDYQTIYGVKNFSTLPKSTVVPTDDAHLVNKKYVDDNSVKLITTNTNIWELAHGVYKVEAGVQLNYKPTSQGYITVGNYGTFLFVSKASNGSVPFYLLGRSVTDNTRNEIYIGVAQNNVYGIIDSYNLGAISSAVTLYDYQTIYGVKNFSTLPKSTVVPTDDAHLVNKKYVDDSFFDIVAPEYSSSATYDVGDFVIHEGLMYTCNTAISTAEAWDSTHWTQTSVNENFGGGSTPLDDIPTFDFTSCIWPAYSWTSDRYAPRGATFLKSTARVLYESFVEVVSTGKKTFIGYTGIGEYPFIYPSINNYSYYVNRAASSTVTYVFKLPICSPKVSNSRPLVSGYVTAFFQVKYDENKDFIEISTNPYPQWWYQNSAYAVATLDGNFHYTIGSTSSDQYSLVYRKYVEDNFLSKVNTTSYTPTTNYNPATKKYVDDLMANIAPIYSSSSTYDVGDYVVYLGLLYKCNTTISTAESWDSTHWDRTTVVDILSNS